MNKIDRRANLQEKYRHELKFICPEEELAVIERRAEALMQPDPHTDKSGEYLIRSIYFDDYQRSGYYENEDGIDPREKFRIRIYNCSDGFISLEKKIKKRGMTGKKSCRIDRDVCMRMIRGRPIWDWFGREPLLDEWILKRESFCLRPVMLGEYRRKPLIYRLGNVRVTFDRCIAASNNFQALFDPTISRVQVLPTGYHVLEVKYDDYLPDVIRFLAGSGRLRQTPFSKFYLGSRALGGKINEFSRYL
ncbi:MAG: polyphosphate polymerase domain-containing protein [Clostridia bacterium]|nr:polyphosphate polymerase domain-containing protein [Clostridia bacterium]